MLLKAFELAQGAIEVALEARFVAKQVIEVRRKRNQSIDRFRGL
jgi:hypothetical protein